MPGIFRNVKRAASPWVGKSGRKTDGLAAHLTLFEPAAVLEGICGAEAAFSECGAFAGSSRARRPQR